MGSNGLTSLLYFLAFGLFFYWMMKRGGCGMHAHGGHGGHDHGGHERDAAAGPPRAHHAEPREHWRFQDEAPRVASRGPVN